MKVTPTTEIGSMEKVQDAKRSVRTDGDFGRVFQEELSHRASTGQEVTHRTSELSPLSTMPVLPLNMGQIPAQGKAETAIENTLDGLSHVEQLLKNAGATPKSVDDAMHNLTAQAAELRHAVETMPADHPLRQIADEISVLTTVESIKWKRGDYL